MKTKPSKEKKIKAWAVIRMSDLDIADQVFPTRSKAVQYRNDTLRDFLKQWPTNNRARTKKVFEKFMKRYSIKEIEIIIKQPKKK
jgi:hypothetical protein